MHSNNQIKTNRIGYGPAFDKTLSVPKELSQQFQAESDQPDGSSPATPAGTASENLAASDHAFAIDAQWFEAIAANPALARLPEVVPGSRAARRRRRATTKRANPLDKRAIERAEQHIYATSRSLASDLLKFRLSIRAGLRAGEIAALRIDDMLTANGAISDSIEVKTLKSRYASRSRKVAMHHEVRAALALLLESHPSATHAAFSIGRSGVLRPQQASRVANWFFRLYKAAGLSGCSSHSGRRTFATEVARKLPAHQGSLKDLQVALGHARLSSTECYLEPSNQMAQIIRSLGS